MGIFRFKQFDVLNERSAMKVNTDGVLLGAVTEVFPEDRYVLDIGTGTGVVALMLAQRLAGFGENFRIEGIDIDGPSAEEAARNFASSPWSGHLTAHKAGLQEYSQSGIGGPGMPDLIVSNPPFFDNSLKAPDARRNAARHTGDNLSFREILEYASVSLSPEGRVSMILPAGTEAELLRFARMCGFAPWRIMRVRSKEGKPDSRIIVRFRRRRPGEPADCAEESSLVLINEEGKRTSQHASLVTDYLL